MLITLKPEEKIIKIFRRYGLTYFWWFWLIFILLVAPFFFMFLLFSWGQAGLALFIGSLALGLILLIRLIYFWHRNALIITSERIVDLHQTSLTNKLVTELGYDKVHNISYQIKGVWPTILRYGQIRIQTVSGDTDLAFARIKKPSQAQEAISAARAAFTAKQSPPARDTNVSLIEKINQLSKEELTALKNVIESRLKIN